VRRGVVSCLTLILLLSAAGLGFTAESTQPVLSLVVNVVTQQGQPLHDSDVFIYAGTTRKLVFRGHTDPSGVVKTNIPVRADYRDAGSSPKPSVKRTWPGIYATVLARS